ncbi:MAG: hypothetical protein IPK19_39960 [Chloroflexi bacterium]|nr:hypothetical protein [Chloroflexota bacterium]
MRFAKIPTLLLMIILAIAFFGSVHAASSGSFVFDYAGDVGDNADGPQFDITLSGPTDDGAGCDEYVMMMFDPSGVVVDVDPGCVVGTTTSDDGDYGSVFAVTGRPITYSLFDIDGAEAAALGAISQSDPAYTAYVLANGVCLDEDYEDASSLLTGLPSLTPYAVCGTPTTTAGGCSLAVPAGSVVGSAPLGAQIYYSPGNATNLTLNPGTYLVVGQDSTETYYKIVLACQFVWVRKDAMGPSFEAPQNGAPLPAGIVS